MNVYGIGLGVVNILFGVYGLYAGHEYGNLALTYLSLANVLAGSALTLWCFHHD